MELGELLSADEGPVNKFITSSLEWFDRKFDPTLGNSIWDREWDVLLIVDAARYDIYREVTGRGKRFWSVGSSSREWMRRTFDDAYTNEMVATAYVTANPYSRDYAPTEQLADVQEVWRTDWDSDIGTVPPDPVTDRIIQIARSGRFGRVIGHYMQPHFPFIGSESFAKMSLENFQEGTETNPWDQVREGAVDPAVVIEAYRENHRFIRDHVDVVLQNVDGTVVLSADHGNALGEFGEWGHRIHLPIPALRAVPWDRYECTDERTRIPEDDGSTVSNGSETTVEEQLEALGYQ